MAHHHLAGILENGTHRLIQRVYYEDTDFSGIVYHARYLHFLERGRTDYLRLAGIDQRVLSERDGLVFVVARMEIDFKASAVMDDVIEITTRAIEARGVKMILDQEIRRDGKLLIAARVTIACVGGGRPRKLPEAVLGLMTG